MKKYKKVNTRNALKIYPYFFLLMKKNFANILLL